MADPQIDLGAVRFAPALLLAPMEGVTDCAFRGWILDCNAPGSVGAACTEFLRVSQHPLRAERIAAHLGPPRADVPVGVQLMGNDPALLAESARNAAAAGAAFVDLNFGCPAPRVFQHCAGSALLDDPPRLQALVAAVAAACPRPVTAKIRAGGTSDAGLEDIAQRIADAGARAITVHARLRVQSYAEAPDWRRIARVVARVSIPVIGNGGAETPAAVDAMRERTGCQGVMIGRGALQNPWIFEDWKQAQEGVQPGSRGRDDYYTWLMEYHRRMLTRGTPERAALGRLKQAARAAAGAGRWQLQDLIPKALKENNLELFCRAMGWAGSKPSMVPR